MKYIWFISGILVSLIGSVIISYTVVTYAQSNNVINGCVKQNNGQLRLVTNPNQCTSTETPTSWNIQGLIGMTGPQGLQGLQGIQGPPGIETMPLAEHYQEVIVSANPGEIVEIPIPKNDVPVTTTVITQNIAQGGVAFPSYGFGLPLIYFYDTQSGRVSGVATRTTARSPFQTVATSVQSNMN